MNPVRILQVGGVLLVLIALGVWRIPGAFIFLDDHPWIVTGFAAYATALATAVIAGFSRGTWGMFKVAKDRINAIEHRLRVDASGLLARLDTQALRLRALSEAMEEGGVEQRTKRELLDEVYEALLKEEDSLQSLRDDAAEGFPELVESLTVSGQCISVTRSLIRHPDGASQETVARASDLLKTGYGRLDDWLGPDVDLSGEDVRVDSLRAAIDALDERYRDARLAGEQNGG